MEFWSETLQNALQEFAREPQSKLPPLLEEFLSRIAATGQCLYSWSLVQPLVLCRLECALADLGAADLPPFVLQGDTPIGSITPHHVPIGAGHYLLSTDGLGSNTTGSMVNNIGESLIGGGSPGLSSSSVSTAAEFEMHSRLLEIRDRVATRVAKFQAAPFTVQRLCELVVSPREHYKRADKFLRGLERTVMVVSSVDPKGNRISDEVAYIDEQDAAAAAAAEAEINGGSPANSCAATSTISGEFGNMGGSTPRSRRSSANGFGSSSPSIPQCGLASPPINCTTGGHANLSNGSNVLTDVFNMPPPTLSNNSGQMSPSGGGGMSPSRPSQALSPGAWRHGCGVPPPSGSESPSYDAAEFRTPNGSATSPSMENSSAFVSYNSTHSFNGEVRDVKDLRNDTAVKATKGTASRVDNVTSKSTGSSQDAFDSAANCKTLKERSCETTIQEHDNNNIEMQESIAEQVSLETLSASSQMQQQHVDNETGEITEID